MKKASLLFLSVALLLACCLSVPHKVSAATEGCYEYEVRDGCATVTKVASETTGDITIPTTLGGCPVTAIGEYAFLYSKVTSVTIPDGVITIADNAFWYCALTKVTIPNSVTSIGEGAFYGCELTEVTIPRSVTAFGSNVFGNCTKLTGIWVDENNVDYISDENGVLFNKDKTILIQAPAALNDGYNIPQSVNIIEEYAFAFCNLLKTIVIPDGVTTIGYMAFSDCSELTTVTIPGSVAVVGQDAFYFCQKLTTVAICDGVTVIGDGAFYRCSGLRNITIPDSVKTVGHRAFADCNNLDYAIYGNVKYLGTESNPYYIAVVPESYDVSEYTVHEATKIIVGGAFSGNDVLTAIYVDENNTAYSSDEFGVLFNKDKTELIQFPAGQLGGYTVPDSVVVIGDSAFADCMGLKTVSLGKNVTTIGNKAFYFCYYLSEITIPSSVTAIGKEAFGECVSITDVYYTGSEAQWNRTDIGYYNEFLTNATIHYAPAQADKGDLDGVAGVTVDDAVYLLQHVLMPSQFPVEQPVDFDYNDIVNIDDAIYLLQHILMPEQFPLN